MKTSLFIAATMFASSVFAQVDITAKYLNNPSFEKDNISSLAKDATRGAYTATSVVGWTLSGTYGVSDTGT